MTSLWPLFRIYYGPEFAGTVLDDAGRATRRCTSILFSRGNRFRMPFIESFNGEFRDECLNEHWFLTFARIPDRD